jgi:hypothetical protein
MTVWKFIAFGISFALLVWLLWKEIRRVNRSRLALRVITSTLAVGALACLALPFTYMRRADAGGKEGILLTEGYDPDSVMQFVQRNPGMEVWDWPSGAGMAWKAAGAKPGLPLPVIGKQEFSGLHVFGYGLTREQWAGIHPPPLVSHLSSAGTGVMDISWKQKLVPGERLQLQGRFLYRTPVKGVKLVLTAMGTVLDSVMGVAPEHNAEFATDFALSAIPAQVGRSVYRLVALAGSDTLEQEEIPLEVSPAKLLRILILASSPDFENTFLMNWLSGKGHGVARRTVVSRGKYDKAFANMPEGPLSPLSAALLDQFDVVLADASALSSSGAGELSALRREVEEKGLGLIVKMDSAATGYAGIGPGGRDGTVGIIAAKDSSRGLYIKGRPGLQALSTDGLSRISAGITLYGAGKVVFTTLNTTYSQVLSGGGKEYAAYWSAILRKAARESEPGEEWTIGPPLSRVGEPVRAWWQTSNPGLPQVYLGGDGGGARSVYLAQDPQLPFYWQGVYWPEEAGWQFARGSQGDTCWWYAWPADGWVNLHRRERRKETLEYMAGEAASGREGRPDGAASTNVIGNGGKEVGTAGGRTEKALIPKGWFYAIFLICALFLWVERKMEWVNGMDERKSS